MIKTLSAAAVQSAEYTSASANKDITAAALPTIAIVSSLQYNVILVFSIVF